jgi:oxygen-independent coproporphyrinogen-3 oxidase
MNAGLYVHLPYCASRCGYCAFVVSTDVSSREAYFAALEREIAITSAEARETSFDSVYLGGGTPSLVPAGMLRRLLERIRAGFELEPESEVTLEANPEDVTRERREDWIAAGITRVSVGVQSFADPELSAVGRRHDAARARESLEILTGGGLSVSGDLILALPTQTAESFRESLETLCDSRVDHVSVYLLETEKSKVLEEDRRARPERYLSDDEQAELWLEGSETLAARGYAHYEISNWARDGRQARHNVKYWERESTLGLGVSAHELWRGRRRANVAQLPAYVERLGRGERPTALDSELTPDQEAAERIMLGLRLAKGVPRRDVEEWIAQRGDARLPSDWETWRERGLLCEDRDRVAFSEAGFLLSNEILCRFV